MNARIFFLRGVHMDTIVSNIVISEEIRDITKKVLAPLLSPTIMNIYPDTLNTTLDSAGIVDKMEATPSVLMYLGGGLYSVSMKLISEHFAQMI